jgi:acyl-CoA thioester hydrolase
MRATTEAPDGVAHRLVVRVYYEDTDAAGIVYYANYLKFAERARTEWLRSLGLTHPALERERGVVFVVRQCLVDYLAPARLDEELMVESRVAEVGCASVVMQQEIARADQRLVRLRVKLAAVGGNGRPLRLPVALRQRLLPPAAVPAAATKVKQPREM